jgi:hypothetical protein
MRVSRGLQSYTPENIDHRHASSASPSLLVDRPQCGFESHACEDIVYWTTPAWHACGEIDCWTNRLLAKLPQHHWLKRPSKGGSEERGGEGGVKAMGPGIACPFEISGRAADVTNLRSPFNHGGHNTAKRKRPCKARNLTTKPFFAPNFNPADMG